MKWFLDPDGKEFSSWNVKALGRHFPNVSMPTKEPANALMIGDKRLLPITDTPPTIDDTQMVQNRSIIVEGDVATAAYTVVPKSAETLAAERKAKVPIKVHAKSARLELLKMGLHSQVQEKLDALPEPDKSVALIEWEYADYYHRDHPLIAALAAAFGLTDEQVDDMFIDAEKL